MDAGGPALAPGVTSDSGGNLVAEPSLPTGLGDSPGGPLGGGSGGIARETAFDSGRDRAGAFNRGTGPTPAVGGKKAGSAKRIRHHVGDRSFPEHARGGLRGAERTDQPGSGHPADH